MLYLDLIYIELNSKKIECSFQIERATYCEPRLELPHCLWIEFQMKNILST